MNLLDTSSRPPRPDTLPTITTERLVLRPFELGSDSDELVALTSDPQTMRYLGDGGTWSPSMVVDMVGRHLSQYPYGRGFGAVVDRETGRFAGWAGIQSPRSWMAHVVDSSLPDDVIEVGWTLLPEWRGRGYATEAASAWLDHGFGTLGLDEIIAVHDPANLASERVMHRLGMVKREMLELTGGDTLCLHVVTRPTWTARG